MSPLLQLGTIALGLYGAGWLARKLGLSSVVGYILLGVVFGPTGPLPFYEVTEITEMLGELGIVLLLFFMGLEFSLRRFSEGGRSIVVAGAIDLVNFLVGVAIGLFLGFGLLAGLFLGGIVYISSSGVIAKLMGDGGLVGYPEAERTLGVLVFEDLAMVVVLGGLGLATAGGSPLQIAGAAVFLVAYLLFLRYGRRPLERLLRREDEMLILLLLALVTLFSVGAQGLNFPEAVAAFLLGLVVSESQYRERVEHTLMSWHDVAAAAFFLNFGLHVDLVSALGQWRLATIMVVATLVTQLASGVLAGRFTGLSRRGSVGHALMLIPRGEFSLVIVALAASVEALPMEVRESLLGATSLYVLAMVLIGSQVFRHYPSISAWLRLRLRSRTQRAAEEDRQRELDAMTLE
ncbi:MAG: cation:proton antiporter [Trueperaceae bacterium]